MQLTEGDDWLVDQLVEALALSRIKERKLKAHIKKHEWDSTVQRPYGIVYHYCGECKKSKTEGHAPDCETKRLLEE